MSRRVFRYRVRSGQHGHPRAAGPWLHVLEHILVAEQALGHYLPRSAEVHHVDGNGRNNAPSNLVVCQDRAYHKLLHCRAEVVAAGGDPNTQKWCRGCRAPRPFGEFNRSNDNKAYGLYSLCRECQRRSFATWSRRKSEAA